MGSGACRGDPIRLSHFAPKQIRRFIVGWGQGVGLGAVIEARRNGNKGEGLVEEGLFRVKSGGSLDMLIWCSLTGDLW